MPQPILLQRIARLLLFGFALFSRPAGAVEARQASNDESPARITILYDAFGPPSALKRGWGYAAFVEYAGKRILFDTGGRLDDFAFNVGALGIDLSRLDFVVLTHRHGDHTAGLHHVLKVNPGVKIYTPLEGGYFDSPVPPALAATIHRRVESAPDDTHYFDGKYPEHIEAQSAWPGARFSQIHTPTEVAPGIWLFSVQSDSPSTREMNEVSMAIRTPRGLAVVVGCSHPGIEKILAIAAKIDPRIYNIFGGFHLTDLRDDEVSGLVQRFHDEWKIERIAAGHCTGEFAFSEFNRVFGSRFDHAGVGAVITLPPFTATQQSIQVGQTDGDLRAEQEIRDMERQWREAWLAGDAAVLDKIHADDFRSIPNIGTVSTKAEVMADVRQGLFQYSRMEHSEMTVRVYGTTAVVVGRTINEGHRGARNVGGDFRYTRIYEKRNGRWQAVLAQYTRIIGPGN